jgi:thiol-disulfide isomerase/thioredoxin
MAGFIEVISRIVRPYKTRIIIFFLLLIFVVAGIWGWRKFVKFNPFGDVANAERRNPEIIVYLFYADWCTHCKKAKPEWAAFKQEHSGTVVNGYQITCKDFECSDENNVEVQNLMAQYKVSSFPTIIMLKNDQEVTYDAKVNKANLEQFVNTLTGTA